VTTGPVRGKVLRVTVATLGVVSALLVGAAPAGATTRAELPAFNFSIHAATAGNAAMDVSSSGTRHAATEQVYTTPTAPAVVGVVADPAGQGYWTVAIDGEVSAYGGAVSAGSLPEIPEGGPIVSVAATPTGRGYWLVGSDGGVFTFGDATFHGSLGNTALNGPIVGIAATPTGRGYWLVGSDGGVFTFGDATFHGSLGSHPQQYAVTAIAATNTGRGYWVADDSGFTVGFGDAKTWP